MSCEGTPAHSQGDAFRFGPPECMAYYRHGCRDLDSARWDEVHLNYQLTPHAGAIGSGWGKANEFPRFPRSRGLEIRECRGWMEMSKAAASLECMLPEPSSAVYKDSIANQGSTGSITYCHQCEVCSSIVRISRPDR